MNLWPFLITRNKQFEYRIVVIPDFLKNDKSYLEDIVGGTEISQEHVVYRYFGKGKTIFWRTKYFLGSYIKSDNDEPLKDEFGRPIRWFEGVIANGDIKKIFSEDIENAHKNIVNIELSKFWSITSGDIPPLFTSKFFEGTNAGKELDIINRQNARLINDHTTTTIDKSKNTEQGEKMGKKKLQILLIITVLIAVIILIIKMLIMVIQWLM